MLPWIESPGYVTANVTLLQGQDQAPAVPVHAHYSYRGTQILNDVAADIEAGGCHPVQLESMVILARVPTAPASVPADAGEPRPCLLSPNQMVRS